MYIKEVKIQNIRSIEHLEMKFEEGEEAGWHVLLGDNGTGKSSIVRAIAIGLIGSIEMFKLLNHWDLWLTIGKDVGEIHMNLKKHIEDGCNLPWRNAYVVPDELDLSYYLRIEKNSDFPYIKYSENEIDVKKSVWGSRQGWFSIGVGPFRRFTGGDPDYARTFPEYSKVLNHITLFSEDALLVEAEIWLKEMHYKYLTEKGNKEEFPEFAILKKFINNTNLLPDNIKLSSLKPEGIFVTNEKGIEHHLYELSDGVKSVLSLVLELFRVLFKTFGNDFFSDIGNRRFVTTRGVVIIDEVDAHLHPTWQTRIGDWFTTYFPQMQFIVTTHSPLICRGAKKGTIWKLPNPGESGNVKQVLGLDKDKLVYGDILDAYSTEAFGKNIERGEVGKEKLKQFSILSQKKAYGGELTKEELEEYNSLKGVFSNDAIF